MTEMLNIDQKWSVEDDPENNDRPLLWYRYGNAVANIWDENNATTAMFYALLAASKALRVPTDEECVGKAHSITSYKNGYIKAMHDLHEARSE